MIRIAVFNKSEELKDGIYFDFEDFTFADCQNLLEICIKNNKTIIISPQKEL